MTMIVKEALEQIDQFESLCNLKIINMDRVREKHPECVEESGQMNWKYFEENIRDNYDVYVRPEKCSVTFNMSSAERFNGQFREFLNFLDEFRIGSIVPNTNYRRSE